MSRSGKILDVRKIAGVKNMTNIMPASAWQGEGKISKNVTDRTSSFYMIELISGARRERTLNPLQPTPSSYQNSISSEILSAHVKQSFSRQKPDNNHGCRCT